MDPMLALGLASNLAQFIDFGLKATSKAREIQKSGSGVTDENADLEFIVKDLVDVNAKLNTSIGSESFKPEGRRTKWKSARKALKTLWGREAVEEMKSRLLGFRDQLQVHMLSLQEHEENNRRRHCESHNLAENQHLETRIDILHAVNGAAESTDTQYQLMRQEIENTLLGNLKVQAAALAASIGFAHLWRAQEEGTAPFSFQRPESSISTATNLQKEGNEDRRHIVPKQRIMDNLNAIHPVDADIQAQFPDLPLLLALNQAEWRPSFSWVIRGSVELPLLFYLPTPSVAYDFLTMAIAFSADMLQVTDEACAENILSELFGNSTCLSCPRGSAQRQRIKNDYRDWQKIAGLLWLDDLFAACHEESCILWQTGPSEVRMMDSALNRDSEPLLNRFWLWLMGGWSTCFSFEVPHNGDTEPTRSGIKDSQNTDFILVHAVAEFLVRSSYQINLHIEQDSECNKCVKLSFVGQQNFLSVPRLRWCRGEENHHCRRMLMDMCGRCDGPEPVLLPCTKPQICGSRGLAPCPPSQTCINDPSKPNCDIAVDCPGICVHLKGPSCGGFAGLHCPRGKVCVDDPRDSCDPRQGGADCIGTCIDHNPQ
ncbi:hypothetical protein GJ744_010922 [Endocarpon pusillum]|uniref:Uncharacterized protein n=1 Tax=Endocarpon pusillum TaxID=364733 RepID=A0A8H7AGQ3_9EURO|nr:hypothetical protein GJ744_010922 [Endocarpon pusillum]